jgi:hypothetical protein
MTNESPSVHAEAEASISLAWGADGSALTLPNEAAFWRVRLLPAKGGHPRVMRHNGVPLILPITATIELLRDGVGGKAGLYRLDPLDRDGFDLRGVDCAVVEIEEDDDTDDDERARAEKEQRERDIAALAKTCSEMAQAITQLLSTMSGHIVQLAEIAAKRNASEMVQ